ncbi:hypothetical protein HMPREF9334_00092 [Selenomonas infelix ATCC 43532]|uniref:Uncharacterized protein n=1 Tax=Selenomonas infelix ATCC 43532 TaxID=679201 RepID=G5GLG2_9FIRM|nr:hypothetical protein HMPREF9334_00092 [Selenomonas infelix ATCC 43532]
MAKTEETEEKDVSKESRKPSEEEALRERIGGAKEGKKAAAESTVSGGNEMATETPVSEGMTKVEKFKAFLEENDLSFFDDPQSFDDEYHTTRFNSRIEAKGQIMPMAIFIDDSIFTIIRTNVAAGINVKNVDRIKNYLNALNAEYKIFKYYLREDGSIYLDVCVPSVAETFDGVMIRTLLGIIVKHLEDVYEDLMAEVWAKD